MMMGKPEAMPLDWQIAPAAVTGQGVPKFQVMRAIEQN
jgi:hypothetical protein